MPAKLTDKQVRQRLEEGRNYKRLYGELKGRFEAVTQEHKQCPQLLADQQAAIETLKIQATELQTMVFGKKKRPPTGTVVPVLPVVPVLRTKGSYRRPIPPMAAITSEVAVPLPEHCVCGGAFGMVTTHERFEEDIPLPELTPNYQAKLVTKYVIARGVCLACGRAASARSLGGQAVTLGSNVRLLVAHLVSVVGMSYTQVAKLLLALYGLVVSGGEIAAMLQKQHHTWLPAYNQLRADIRAAPVVHADETPWPIQQEGGGYAWVLADASSPRVCYDLATSRGAPHAKRLFGQSTSQPFAGVRITDDYGAYRNPELPGTQQLCWAHLYRVIRDLKYNVNLPQEQLQYVSEWYAGFAGIYQDLRQYLGEPYNEATRTEQSSKLWRQTRKLAEQPVPCTGEPDKLTRLKAQLIRAGQHRLFTCLVKNTPCDNNRAERDLRQLVLKRKRSFGSQTEKGAKALAAILSVCTTTWRIQPQGYFQQLALLG